jgi:hypothetical protein
MHRLTQRPNNRPRDHHAESDGIRRDSRLMNAS